MPTEKGRIVKGLMNPVPGAICESTFSEDHKAVDISADCGTPVYAACGGKVGYIETQKFGKGVVVQHDNKCKDESNDWTGYSTYYGRLSKITPSGITTLKQGDEIGEIDDTGSAESGCHLHFVLFKRRENFLEDGVDPAFVCEKSE